VLKMFKNGKHTPYIIELDGESPVIIDLLNSLVPLAKKIKNPNSEVKQKLCDLISLLIASQMGEADKMVQELIVRNGMKDLDMNYLSLLNEETRPKD
jgi:hypothetical protein